MKPSLYELSTDYIRAFEELSETDGITPDVIEDSLSLLYGDVETKAINVAKYMLGLDAQAKAIKEAESAMKARRNAIEKNSSRFKEYLLVNMQRCGITELSCPHFMAKVQKNPASVIIDDAEALLDDYKRIYTVSEPDKLLIKQAINDGYEVKGAHIEHGYSLRIR